MSVLRDMFLDDLVRVDETGYTVNWAYVRGIRVALESGVLLPAIGVGDDVVFVLKAGCVHRSDELERQLYFVFDGEDAAKCLFYDTGSGYDNGNVVVNKDVTVLKASGLEVIREACESFLSK